MLSKFFSLFLVLFLFAGLTGCVTDLRGQARSGMGFQTDTQVYFFHNVIRNEEQTGVAGAELKGSLAEALVGLVKTSEEAPAEPDVD